MLDTLTSENWRDFSQRYKGTYGWYSPEKGTKIPVFISEVAQDHLKFVGLDNREFEARADKGVAFQFAPLNRRIHVGNDGHAYVVCRRPARQYRRGICGDNTFIYRLTAAGVKSMPISTATMKILLAEEGMKVSNGVKLSNAFCLVGPAFYAYEQLIGAFADNSITLNPRAKLLIQEVKDAIRDSSLNFKVE